MKTTTQDDRFESTCLVIGQLITTTSTFFWMESGRHNMTGSVLVIMAMVFWAVGFVGLFRHFDGVYGKLGLLYAFYGCLGGIGFGFEGLYSLIVEGDGKIGVVAHEQFPLAMNIVLFWSGPAFPLTLIIWGVMSLIRKVVPVWIATLVIVGAIMFPVSRIMRIEWLAHVADVALLLPTISLLSHAWSKTRPR